MLASQCDYKQTDMIKKYYEFQHAHWGVDRTYNKMTMLFQDDTKQWSTSHKDVRDFIKRCPTA